MSIRPAVRSVAAYRFRARPAAVKLDQNELPLDLPASVRRRFLGRLEEVALHRYPEIHGQSLARKLAERFAWPEDGVVVAGGSNVLIQALVIAAGIGQRVLTVTPTFPVYGMQAELLGVRLTEVPLLRDFGLPRDALAEELRDGPGVLFLANPAAPTGNLFALPDLARLAEDARGAWTIVIDEAYGAFADSSHLPLVRSCSEAVGLRTFSKAFGLAGARLGFALANPDLARELRKTVLPFSISHLQIAAGLTLLEEEDLVAQRIAAVVAERDRVFSALSGLPEVHPFPSRTNFILFRASTPDVLYEALLERGVLIRRQDHLPGLAGCLRVTIGLPDENDAFLEALGSSLAAEVDRG